MTRVRRIADTTRATTKAGTDTSSGADSVTTRSTTHIATDAASGSFERGTVGTGTTPPTGFWSTAFLDRPVSPALNLTSNTAVAAASSRGTGTSADPYVISNRAFDTLGADVIAIAFRNLSAHVLVEACDFRNVAEGIYGEACTGSIKVGWCRYKNIIGPAQPRVGKNIGNFIQMYVCKGGGRIYNNKGREGDTEDVVSLVSCSGWLVEDNHFQGTNWTSGSGSGIALGDIGGSNNTARRNKLMDIGQVGIFIAGGTNNTIADNTLYKSIDKGGSGDVGVYIWKNPPTEPEVCSGHTFTGNKVYWEKLDGSQNPYWDGGNCGTIIASGNTLGAGAAAVIDLPSMTVVL